MKSLGCTEEVSNASFCFLVLSVSAAHIKHLIRNGDIDRLEQLILEGQGKKMVGEYSADYKTRTFLKSVPALMVNSWRPRGFTEKNRKTVLVKNCPSS